jgi:HD-GYP domain-containing protein (c-di-GMP phosphodiesterase class II)
MMHDIGKYRVPAEILARPLDLAPDEYEVVKQHTIWGHHLLRDNPAFELASQVARWHHERWDGRGYPDGLAGDEIPLAVSIASATDALDAMIYDRVYRDAMAPDDALRQMALGSGTQFSPRVVEALLELHGEGLLPIPLLGQGRRRKAA